MRLRYCSVLLSATDDLRTLAFSLGKFGNKSKLIAKEGQHYIFHSVLSSVGSLFEKIGAAHYYYK